MIDLYRYVIGVLGSITFCFLLGKIYYLKRIASPVREYITRLGTVSLQIYLMQRSLIEEGGAFVFSRFVDYIGVNIFVANLTIYNLLLTPMAAGAAAIILERTVRVCQKIGLAKYLFGR